MQIKLAILTAGFGCTLAASAWAMPLSTPANAPAVTPVRTVCNEYGRCWDRDDDYRGEYRRDWDGGRRYRRDYDRDRDYRRHWRDDDD